MLFLQAVHHYAVFTERSLKSAEEGSISTARANSLEEQLRAKEEEIKELAKSRDHWAAQCEEEIKLKDAAQATLKADRLVLERLDGDLKKKEAELTQTKDNLSKSKKKCDLLNLALQRKDLAFQEKEAALTHTLREIDSLKASNAELAEKCKNLEMNKPESSDVEPSDDNIITIAGDVLYSSRMNELATEYADRVFVFGFKAGADYVKDTIQKSHRIELNLSECPDYEPECRVPPLTETIPRHFPLVPRRDTVEPPKCPGDFIKRLTCPDDDRNEKLQEEDEEEEDEEEGEDSEGEEDSQVEEGLDRSLSVNVDQPSSSKPPI